MDWVNASIAFVALIVFSSIPAAAQTPVAPLPLPPGFGTAFRDANLEKRCEVLAGFVSAFAAVHLPKTVYQGKGCGEGNGLGGARYNLDFQLNGHAYRFDIAFSTGNALPVVLCDTQQAPTICSQNQPFDHLAFKPAAKQEPGSALAAAKTFLGMADNAKYFLPTLAAWVGAKQSTVRIFNQEYRTFVSQLTGTSRAFPAGDPPSTARIQLTLSPSRADHPESGKAVVSGTASQSLLSCFGCPTTACINTGLIYRFDDRFFSITKTVSEHSGAKEANRSAGWVIEGPQPTAKPVWTYVCGASRYSLHSLD